MFPPMFPLSNTTNQATIQKLQHVLAPPTNTNDTTPHEKNEFINENTPIIRTMSQQTPKILQPRYIHAPESYTNPLSINILSQNGEINLTELHTLQDQLLQPIPINYFKPYQRQYFQTLPKPSKTIQNHQKTSKNNQKP